jgi:hypothetical protein
MRHNAVDTHGSPIQGPSADSEGKRVLACDVDTVLVDSMKVLSQPHAGFRLHEARARRVHPITGRLEKRTSSGVSRGCPLSQGQTHATQQIASSVDRFGAATQRRWNHDAE